MTIKVPINQNPLKTTERSSFFVESPVNKGFDDKNQPKPRRQSNEICSFVVLKNLKKPETKVKNKYWSQNRNKWINEKEFFPFDEESNILIVFIPKKFVESKLVFSHKRFYNEAMIPYLGEDAVRNRLEGLIRILKNNTIKPKKIAIRKKYPCKKEVVNDFIKQNNEVYKNYKKKELKYLNCNNYK